MKKKKKEKEKRKELKDVERTMLMRRQYGIIYRRNRSSYFIRRLSAKEMALVVRKRFK